MSSFLYSVASTCTIQFHNKAKRLCIRFLKCVKHTKKSFEYFQDPLGDWKAF